MNVLEPSQTLMRVLPLLSNSVSMGKTVKSLAWDNKVFLCPSLKLLDSLSRPTALCAIVFIPGVLLNKWQIDDLAGLENSVARRGKTDWIAICPSPYDMRLEKDRLQMTATSNMPPAISSRGPHENASSAPGGDLSGKPKNVTFTFSWVEHSWE